MAEIKVTCACGAILEYTGEVQSMANRCRDFLTSHSDCRVTNEFVTMQTIDSVTDFENALRESMTEPLERIAKALETVAECMPSRWQGGPK